MNREEYETLINNIRDGLDETTRATQSENFLNAISSYNGKLEEINALQEENEKLKQDKDELLLTNGKLFQQIGFPHKEEERKTLEEKQEKIKLEDIINERGELI